MAKKFGGLNLSRGINSMIPTDDDEKQSVAGASSINDVKISEIEANPDQPRRVFDEEALNELADSIKQIGVVQPITLRKLADGKYQIVAGERRYRASQIAGLESIPAYIREVNESQQMEMALIENIQREDLNAIEEALAYQNLMDKCDYTQDQLSERVGKKRATVANYLRLLRLPAEIQMAVKDKKIDMGHARALMAIEDPVAQLSVYNQIISEGLSVRKVEELAKSIKEGKTASPEKKESPKKDLPEDYAALKDRLNGLFNTPVSMTCDKKGKGKITIQFNSDDDLLKIMNIFDSIKN
ncbi:MAG: ParB/RepB/Spo0J family partition protein [Paludibacteraceae bacterium]|nr:ParB/RepB/Spo0J family partition protein [Paludibacteraceae bacterium]MBP5481936.1 ParB/RepB/Spo0J family partition protein [Paludibacteraceae bacterium]